MANLVLISTILTAVLAFGLGVFSLVRNPHSPVVRLWFFLSLAVTIWTLGYFGSSSSKTDELAFQYLRVVYVGASIIPILFFHFITAFLYKTKSYQYLLSLGYILAVIFLILNTTTKLVIKGVTYMESFGRYEEVTAVGFKIFLLYFFFFTLFAVVLLLKDYGKSDGIRRRQMFYLILASVVGFAGGTSNFLTDLTGIYPYGQLIVWLYPIIITYGIFVDEFKFKIKF